MDWLTVLHFTQTSFFGEGTYLSSDLTVCMMYSHYGQGWENSVIGDKMSCVAVCEILDHPDVKCTIKSKANTERQNRSRARARNSEGGDVPERYYVVTNNQAVRVKYVLVYAEKKNPKRFVLLNNDVIILHKYRLCLISGEYSGSIQFKNLSTFFSWFFNWNFGH